MTNMSSYQRHHWYPLVAEDQHGEYCRACGISKNSNWKDHPFTGLRVDKINNDGNHNICDNTSTDFQLLCISCNLIKNHPSRPVNESDLQMTQSERKNLQAEKPLMEWLFSRIQKGSKTGYKWFVAEGSYLFDVSPKTIDERYFKKYFEAESAPFELYYDEQVGKDFIRFKESWMLKNKHVVNLDIVGKTPTPSLHE